MDEILVVFCENLLEIMLSFVIGMSKVAFFVEQILNSIVVFILGQMEYDDALRAEMFHFRSSKKNIIPNIDYIWLYPT